MGECCRHVGLGADHRATVGRGIAVFANLLLMPVAWYVSQSHQPAYAVAVAAVVLTALVLLFSPAAIRWASGSAKRPGQSIVRWR